MGTPSFAVPSLERIVEAGHSVVVVFTQPDRPKGRGQKDAMPPVKEAALRLGLPVHQPDRVRRPEIVEQLRALAAEAMVVVGYGQIIPKAILDIPPQGIINVHASLLPKYRGAAPIQWAIARGEKHTGVTTMRINEGLDTGDMLLRWETAIGAEENAVELAQRLAAAGAELLVRTLAELQTIRPEPQDDSQATHAPILKKEDGKIDWQLSAQEILNRIRGFEPWPGGYGFLRGQRLQIWNASIASLKLTPGTLKATHRTLYAGCGRDESIELREIQLEGKKRMPVAAFLNGFPLSGDEVLA
ncbi:MAG: methionyl-tRNA formyltransferase [Acidobacteriota bacterium]|nr:methionyl-tRNA formyltransferase [Acidobacteriota bacterium]